MLKGVLDKLYLDNCMTNKAPQRAAEVKPTMPKADLCLPLERLSGFYQMKDDSGKFLSSV